MTSAAHLPGAHFGHRTSYANLAFLGPDSHAMLLGIFQVLLNIVTLVVGAVGLLLSRSGMAARTFLSFVKLPGAANEQMHLAK